MNTIAQPILDFLATQSLHLLILFALVLTATALLRGRSAHIRYLLWLLIIAKCFTPPLHTLALPLLPEAKNGDQYVLPSESPLFESSIDNRPSSIPVLPSSIVHRPSSIPTPSSIDNRPSSIPTSPSSIVNRQSSIFPVLWSLWLAGTALYLLTIATKSIRFNRYLRRHRTAITPQTHPAWTDFLALHLPRRTPLRLYQLSRPGQPFVWGLLRPAIYLPSNFAAVNDPQKQHSILMHEAGHILRLDPLVNLLQVAAQGLFWFHPLVWIANHRIRAEREKCCDEFAVATLNTAPHSYCTAIVDALMAARTAAPAIPTLAVAGPVKNIEDRIKTLLTPNKKFHTRPTLTAILAILTLACPKGTEWLVRAVGDDSEALIEALSLLFEQKFGETR